MAKSESFIVNNTLKFTSTWKVAGVLTTPATYELKVEEPDGTDQTPSVSVDSTGVLSATFAPDQTGYHHYRWTGTGSAAGVKEGRFYVASSPITDD